MPLWLFVSTFTLGFTGGDGGEQFRKPWTLNVGDHPSRHWQPDPRLQVVGVVADLQVCLVIKLADGIWHALGPFISRLLPLLQVLSQSQSSLSGGAWWRMAWVSRNPDRPATYMDLDGFRSMCPC